MTENQNPEQITEDVEGHATRVKVLHSDDTADVEGHATRVKVLHSDDTADDGDDVEGHVTRGRG